MNKILDEMIRFIGRFILRKKLACIRRKDEQTLRLTLNDLFQAENRLIDLVGIFNLSDQRKNRLGLKIAIDEGKRQFKGRLLFIVIGCSANRKTGGQFVDDRLVETVGSFCLLEGIRLRCEEECGSILFKTG